MIRQSDYENYDYRLFWKENNRDYEDMAERLAIKKLLYINDQKNRVFVDLGCGFGRLFNEYEDFNKILLIDYSVNNLMNAKLHISQYLSKNKKENLFDKIVFIAADVNNLPVKDGTCDFCLTVRVIHHLPDLPRYFSEVKRIARPGSVFVLEFANKRNFKNIIKFFFGRLKESPFSSKPLQIGQTILNYHPKYVRDLLGMVGFKIVKQISVSNFRLSFLKKMIGLKILLFFENAYQRFFSFTCTGPSIFLKTVFDVKEADRNFKDINNLLNSGSDFYKEILICPRCKSGSLDFSLLHSQGKILCSECRMSYLFNDGIFDFKI